MLAELKTDWADVFIDGQVAFTNSNQGGFTVNTPLLGKEAAQTLIEAYGVNHLEPLYFEGDTYYAVEDVVYGDKITQKAVDSLGQPITFWFDPEHKSSIGGGVDLESPAGIV